MRLATYPFRELYRRPGRTLLTLLGIAIGVATGVATSATTLTAHRAYHDLFENTSGKPSLEVVAAGHGGFDPGFAAGLRDVVGVAAVVPRIQSTATLLAPSGPVPLLVLGLPAGASDTPAGEDGLLLDASLAGTEKLTLGTKVRLWTPGGPAQLVLRGHPAATAAFAGVPFAVVSLTTAQRLFGMRQRVNSVQLVLADGVPREQVEAAVAAHLPAGLVVQAPAMRAALAESTLQSAEQGLGFLSLMAVVAAAFVVLNTFLLNLGERGRQLATLRVLGATRAQVVRLLLGEALLLGLAGAVLGLLLGVGLAWMMTRVMGPFLGVVLPSVGIGIEQLLLAVVLGPGASLAAVYFPARQAGRRDPLPALREQRTGSSTFLPRWAPGVGALLLAIGAMIEAALWHHRLAPAQERWLLAPGIALVLAGSVLLLPLLLHPLLGLCARLPVRLLRLEGSLAVCQLRRHPVRTSLTTGVLFLAVVVALGFGHTLQAILGDLRHWYEHTVVADFLVRPSQPDPTFLLAAGVPEALGDEIAALDGVDEVCRIAFVPARAAGQPVLVLARTFSKTRPLPLDLQEGEAAAVAQGLARGEVVLGTVLAHALGVHAGDDLVLDTDRGPRSLRIAGTATEYAVGGQALYLEWATARRLLGVSAVHAFLVSARPGQTDALAPVLRRYCGAHQLLLQPNAELRRLIDRLLAGVTAALWALMALGFVVAALGIVNTLTMNALEQSREFAVLRALGMRRGQVGRMVLAQALLTAALGALLGTGAGTGMAFLLSRSTTGLLGKSMAFRIDPALIAGCAGLVLIVAALASLLPARRAACGEVIRALRQV